MELRNCFDIFNQQMATNSSSLIMNNLVNNTLFILINTPCAVECYKPCHINIFIMVQTNFGDMLSILFYQLKIEKSRLHSILQTT